MNEDRQDRRPMYPSYCVSVECPFFDAVYGCCDDVSLTCEAYANYLCEDFSGDELL